VSRLAAALVVVLTVSLVPVAAGIPSAEAASPDLRAVVVGINQFLGKTRPNIGAAQDAMNTRDLLVRNGWPESSIRLLTDAGATAANMRSALQWLSENKDPDSYSVFFYSGHVKQVAGDPDHDGEDLDEFLWPHDNQFISDGELAGYLKGIGGHAWIAISGCEASGFDDGVSSDKRIFTASSLESEKSYEYPQWSSSVWAGLFVEQGMLQGKADADHDGTVTLFEASDYAARIAPQMTAGQETGPQHPYLSGGGGGGPRQTLRPPTPPPAAESAPAPAPANPAVPPLCLGTICLQDLLAGLLKQ
jgi:caspase domain-containing protein